MGFSGAFVRPFRPIFDAGAAAAVITWLLRDDFTDTLAAGSVNGTAATPGPGTRVVVDTNSKLSIGDGYANQATGGASGVDPSYGLSTGIVRTPGRFLVARFLINVQGAFHAFGYQTTSDIGAGSRLFFVPGASLIYAYESYSYTTKAIGTASYDTIYMTCSILRSIGSYFFVKGGIYTNWTLVWVSQVGNEATLYARFLGSSAGAQLKTDFIRVPDALWLPTPLCYDTFTRANGALGSTETTGPDGQTTPALAWTNQAGTSAISSNAIITTVTDGAKAIATVPAGADVLASAALTRNTGTPGIVFRYLNALNYGYAIHNGTNAQLHKVVNGVDSTLVNAAASYGAGRVLQVICYGTKWRMYYNNALIGAEQTVSDADLQAGTGVGWYSTDTDSIGDLFTVFARGSGGEYDAYLDPYTA